MLTKLFEFFGFRLTVEPPTKPTMNPLALSLIIGLVEEAIKDTPPLIADLQAIFVKTNPTPADWEALRAKVLSESYASYVPASNLPAGGGTA